MPPALVGRVWLAVLALGCGGGAAADPTRLPAARWGAEFAAAECARIFGCCDATERMRWGYADEAQCPEGGAADVQKYLDSVLSVGWVTFDEKAARRCVDGITTVACSDLLPIGKTLFAASCVGITRGTGKIGAICEDLDVICESSNCLSGSGTCGPTRGCTVTCAASEFCDTAAQACAALKTEATPCSGTNECVFPLTCQSTGVCAPGRQGGAACVSAADCASSSCTDAVCDGMM